jgi:hypothetical protein
VVYCITIHLDAWPLSQFLDLVGLLSLFFLFSAQMAEWPVGHSGQHSAIRLVVEGPKSKSSPNRMHLLSQHFFFKILHVFERVISPRVRALAVDHQNGVFYAGNCSPTRIRLPSFLFVVLMSSNFV